MFKACCDCISGNQEGTHENSYGTQMNLLNGDRGSFRAPPWPEPETGENMFVLPRSLGAEDIITVNVQMYKSRKLLTVGLLLGHDSPDKSNIACQLEVKFQLNEGSVEDRIFIQKIKDGNLIKVNQEPATGLFENDPESLLDDFTIKFSFKKHQSLEIYVGVSYLEEIELTHSIEDIRFLAVGGDIEKVKKLEFDFA